MSADERNRYSDHRHADRLTDHGDRGKRHDVARVERRDGCRLRIDHRPFGARREKNVLDAIDQGHVSLQ